MSTGQRIIDGLREAVAYAPGEPAGARIHGAGEPYHYRESGLDRVSQRRARHARRSSR